MPDWRVSSARLTVFVTPDTEVPNTLWRDMVGEDPESSIIQRATSTRTETGPFADGTLTLQVQPMRVDWNYEPIGVGLHDGLPPVLGAFPTAAGPLLQFGYRWVRAAWFPSTSRIALAFVLISATANRERGYRELDRYIDGVPSTPDATDFHYQVNRPRASRAGLDGLQINRLSKWSVGGYGSVFFAPGVPNASPTQSPLLYHLRVELDISTSAAFNGLIPRDTVQSVLDDLFNGATEIAERGNRL